MIRRNLIVAYKPIRSNSLALSELNHRMMMLNDNNNSCLNLTNNHVDFYCSWLPYGDQSIRDTEIGINASVAEAIGLYEGSIVSCKLVEDLPALETVYVTATNQKDWEMLEASSYRIQNTLLDQTKIVNEKHKLVVWINNAIHICIMIDKIYPEVKYGKIDNNTEFIVTPFKEKLPNTNSKSNNIGSTSKKDQNQNSLYQRLFNKDTNKPHSSSKEKISADEGIIDSTTLDNVSVRSSSTEEDSSESDGTIYDGNSEKPRNDSDESLLCKNDPDSRRSKMKLDLQVRLFDTLLIELKNQDRKSYKFRAIPRAWDNSQMCDVFLTKHNTPKDFKSDAVFILNCECINENDDRIAKEYYVYLRTATESPKIPKTIYPSIEINDILMAKMKISKFNRVSLSTKKTVLNFFEKIELIPVMVPSTIEKQEIEEDFKRLLIQCTRSTPLLINQEQIFKLGEGNVLVTAKIYPESFRYCLCDAEILRENKIFISENAKDIGNLLTSAEEMISPKSIAKLQEKHTFMHIDEYQNIIEDCLKKITIKNCLHEKNGLRKLNNYIIMGPQSTGKSTICRRIIEKLGKPPYNCYVASFPCTQNKARKIESIQKDLRNILVNCVERAPSVLLLENLDTLAKTTNEHSQNADYYNQVSDIIKNLIGMYTSKQAISVIATVTSINNLNHRIYTSRGNHAFEKMFKISDLLKSNREKIIRKLCQNNQLKCLNINYDKFSNLTEGYTIGYLLQFVDRAIFYAHRNDNNNPVLTNDVLVESLKTTNAYCLQGIKNNLNLSESGGIDSIHNVNLFAGLESAVSVFEEVLIWPTKYPEIFGNSPLRNQAGILLYGAPGTGKTHLVTQISNYWNLRMIAVKGPELLAKFIGQSEENVRNLFERARNAKPCVLFFDEFDSIAPRRGHDSTGVTDRVVNQLLTELDGVEELKGVVVVAATSRPDLLDPALLRSGRIDRLIHCALPDETARLNIFKTIAQTSSLRLTNDVDFKVFCNSKSQNYTGADIKSILVSANMNAVKESIANCIPDEIHISQEHILEAFNNTTPSLSSTDTVKYKSLYSRFMNQELSNAEFTKQRATLA